MADGKISFEQALERLEQISARMADPELPLEESMELYAESVRLVAMCQKSIEQARLQIETLENRAVPAAAPVEEGSV